METYRLKSKLTENDREYLLQTSNDARRHAISSIVYVDGCSMETMRTSHPEDSTPEEVVALVKLRHGAMKKEVERLLAAYRRARAGGDIRKMHELGVAFYYRRFYSEARDLFRSALELNPDHHQSYYFLGRSELSAGNRGEAISAAMEAVHRCPTFADYRYSLGEAYLANRSCKRAIIEFEEATRINLYYSDAYFNLGLALILNAVERQDVGLFENVISRSVDCFTKAAYIYPEYDTPDFQQGLDALRESGLSVAYDYLRKVQAEKQENDRLRGVALHTVYSEGITWDEVNERIRYLRSIVERNPSYVDLRLELACCCFDQARLSWEEGTTLYRQALQMNPTLRDASDYLVEADREYENIRALVSRISAKG